MAERAVLQEIWGAEEWSAARRTVLNAHYTHPDYVEAMWGAVTALGVPATATVLEPGCGTGNFIAAAPEGTHLVGVELDPTTAKIAGLMNPDAHIRNESFAATMLDHDGYDAVIGNVPFGQVRLYDPAYNPENLSLHNHFIVKSLRQTKPGGIVAVMSSRWTMDAKSERARREISQYGELLGAVRMPASSHQEVAGTDATIDVLVFRRHTSEPSSDPSWLKTIPVAEEVHINTYFDEHPSQVLGVVGTRKGQFGPELTVSADDVSAATIAPRLAHAFKRVVDEARASDRVWAAELTQVTDRPVAAVVQDPANIVGHIAVDEAGELTQIGVDGPEPVRVPKNAAAELKHLLVIRDAAVNLLEAEAATSQDTKEIAVKREHLNVVYDQHVAKWGPLGRVTTTVKERPDKDPLIRRIYPPAIRALRLDPHFATVIALERYNEDTGEARKATVFHRRVVGAVQHVERVSDPDDAIRISLDRTGRVDIPLVAELLDESEDLVPELLAERVFLSPVDQETYIPSIEFLSGNVRQKLYEVQELAQEDERFAPHVAALEHVIPEEVGPAEIDVRFGAAWVPIGDVSKFIEKELGKEVKSIERIDGEWKFAIRGKASQTAEARWAVTGDYTGEHAMQVLKKIMNGDRLELRYRPDPADDKMLVDQVATEAFQERAQELHEVFQDWLWSDNDRVERLQKRYNDLYNGIVLRSYDDVQLTLPGKAASFHPHPHQYAAVARMLAEPATGLFHEVGAGKTAEMVMGVMEMRRLGMVQKPAILVPNQMLEQFTREFKQIYPRARVLSAGSEDLRTVSDRNGRRQFVARARTGDWDAVIMTHSSFGKVGLGEANTAYAAQRLQELEELLAEKLDSSLSNSSVKRLEGKLADDQEKLRKMMDIDHDQGISWEETGIDYLCVDEAHLFKNLTVHSKVEDLAKSDGSARAQDLDMKLWYHRDYLQQSRVATLATATPLPNSMIEMYVMMRYLRPDLLREAEVLTADDWARQFTEQVTGVEPGVDGTFTVKTRTTKFRNLPELLRMWHVPGDVKTQTDLALNVPAIVMDKNGNRVPEMVVVDPTEAQAAGMADIIERAERVRSRLVEPEEDNMLKITSNGRALALDARLMGDEGPAEDELTKLDIVARNVYATWEEHRENEYADEWGDTSPTPGALQIIFSDLGTPKDDGRWNAYTYLRQSLVGRGIPAEQIKFIHEAANDQAKAELFQQARDGHVQVLIGSTEKMGVGTNIQSRAVAMHHVDAPWRPADVTQREGRIIRQGNQNSEVQMFRYSTEGSFDAYMWGTLSRKAQFIEQVLAGRLDVREVDNSSEMALQFAEMQAITIGDMRILESANLKQDVDKLSRQQRAYRRKITSIEVRANALEQATKIAEHDVKALHGLAPRTVDTRGEAFRGKIGTTAYGEPRNFQGRKEFGEALRDELLKIRTSLGDYGISPHNAHYPRRLPLAVMIGGVTWEAHLRWNLKDKADPWVEFTPPETHQALHHKMLWGRATSGELGTVSQGFESRVRDIPDLIDGFESQLAESRAELATLHEMRAEPWAKASELTSKQARLAELTQELADEAQPASQPQAPTQVMSPTPSIVSPAADLRP